jgi:hypothetical protein
MLFLGHPAIWAEEKGMGLFNWLEMPNCLQCFGSLLPGQGNYLWQIPHHHTPSTYVLSQKGILHFMVQPQFSLLFISRGRDTK